MRSRRSAIRSSSPPSISKAGRCARRCGSGPLERSARARDRAHHRRGAAGRARSRHRASRSQAGEHHHHAERRREDSRLRPRAIRCRRAGPRVGDAPDRSRRDRRHAALHGARAAARPADQRAHRSIRVRRAVLRNADGPPSLRQRRPADDDRQDAGRVSRQAGDRRRAVERHQPHAGKESRRSFSVDEGSGRGAGR